jgi:hypothetical protein
MQPSEHLEAEFRAKVAMLIAELGLAPWLATLEKEDADILRTTLVSVYAHAHGDGIAWCRKRTGDR